MPKARAVARALTTPDQEETPVTVPATTAEWLCTRCGSTNRILVAADTARVTDRCVHCRAKHVVEPSERPVRWTARLQD